MQTVLGAGGAIGTEITKALTTYTNKIRLVSRNPKKVNDSDVLFKADLTKPDEVLKAVQDSDIIYLTVGLPYNLKIWQTTWHVIMKNVINTCKQHNAKLVFFDNTYMYDENHLNPITEDAPINPPSEKGKVRAQIAEMLLKEVRSGDLKALIARCADYYGPNIKNTSMLTETVFKNLNQGKKANWLGSAKFKHSFTFTPDAGKATALLGNTENAYGEVWHLPTASNPFTGEEWVKNIAAEMGLEAKYQVAPKFLVRVIGLFQPIMKEMVEMMYQYDRDYVFDSSKFENRFGINPTPYKEGIKHIVDVEFRNPKKVS